MTVPTLGKAKIHVARYPSLPACLHAPLGTGYHDYSLFQNPAWESSLAMNCLEPMFARYLNQFLLVAAITVSACLLGGCGDSGRVPVYPVRGKVLLDGEPAVGAYIKFIAVNPNEKTKWMIPKGDCR